MYGDEGDDSMHGAGGDDTLDGGPDNDFVSGGPGDDYLYGGSGKDTLIGGSGVDQLYGGSGNDTLVSGYGGGAPIDVASLADAAFDEGGFMDGGIGDDTLRVDVFLDGALSVDGGADTDVIDFSASVNVWAAGIPSGLPTNLLDLESGIGETPFGGQLTVARVENITGGEYRDEFYGNDSGNILKGRSGNDVLEGRGGADTLDGGAGHDVAQYTSAPGGVEVDLTRTLQNFVGNGDAAGDTLISIEELRGSDFGDIFRGTSAGGEVLSGDAGGDILEGRGGGDTLEGGPGFDYASYESSAGRVEVSLSGSGFAGSVVGADAAGDTLIEIEGLIGSAYNDVLVGNEGVNALKGGAGADQLTGGLGTDFFTGGSGADVFKYLSVLDSNGMFGVRDAILDFERSFAIPVPNPDGSFGAVVVPGDRIDLSAIDANQLAGATGNQAFNFIGGQGFTAAGQVRVIQTEDIYDRSYSLVQAEVNGDNVADFQLTVYTVNGSLLGATDLIF